MSTTTVPTQPYENLFHSPPFTLPIQYAFVSADCAVVNRVHCISRIRQIEKSRISASYDHMGPKFLSLRKMRLPGGNPEFGTDSTLLTACGAPNPPLLTLCQVGTLTPARHRRLYVFYGLC